MLQSQRAHPRAHRPSQPASRPSSRGFIAGPLTDTVFLIAAPLVGVVLFLLLAQDPVMFYDLPPSSSFIGKQIIANISFVVIYAHLFITVFRSHTNPAIFRRYPLRFTLVPLVLFGVLWLSPWALAAATILSVWWDVYHSSLQTFGIGRLYDKLQGNDLTVGRRLDIMLNLLFYAGPILGGVTLMDHLSLHQRSTHTFPTLETLLFQVTPAQHSLTYGLLAIGISFTLYYCYAYWRLAKQGYRVSYQKVCLLAILAVVSLVFWGFDAFGGAFFVMNFFHALQYFFLVWFVEKQHITSLFRLTTVRQGQTIALSLFLFIGIAYGVWSQTRGLLHFPQHTMICILLVISLMHFWYDGFVWSVRKNQL